MGQLLTFKQKSSVNARMTFFSTIIDLLISTVFEKSVFLILPNSIQTV